MIIARQSPEQLASFNFIMNFGVSTETKRILETATNMNLKYETFASKISSVNMKEILIIYKYLVYSDKRIHHIMYKETVNEINENLLADFIDSDDENKIIEPKALSIAKWKSKFDQSD